MTCLLPTMLRRGISLRALICGATGVLLLAALSIRIVLSPSQRHALSASRESPVSDDPRVLLGQANRLLWLFNSGEAGPLYQRAAVLFAESGDIRNTLYALAGSVRSQAETMSFVDISDFLAGLLKTPLVERDDHLRLWCLVSKGMTDIEIDGVVAKRDWEQAQNLASALGDNGWANRARGELGLLAFLEGDPRKASRLVGEALLGAMASGDIGGQVRYLAFLGNGLNELNRQDESIRFFDRAIKISKNTHDAGFPFMAYEGKADALVALNRSAEAEGLLMEALDKAQAESKSGHETQVLILLGELALKSGSPQRAVDYLEDAGQRGSKLHFYRMVAQAMLDLATVYRDRGDLAGAEDRLTRGVEASSRVGDRYYLPRDLKALAEVKAERGQFADAHRLYLRAEDIIDGMLAHSPGPYTESSLVGAMSSVYLGDFTLAARQRDTATAFAILERVRGRTAADMLRNHSIPVHESPNERAFEEQVSMLQVRLMRSDDLQERSQLRDSLVEAEERLNYSRESFARASQLMPTHSIPLGAAQEMLRPDEMVLEYVLAEPVAFCLTLRREGADLVALPAGGKTIETLVSAYLSAVKSGRPADEQEKQLYSLLLDPIRTADRKLRFVIVPDGGLHMLPFESLRDGSGRYLVWDHVLSYAPSTTALYLLRHSKRTQHPQLAFLGVGDIRYEADRPLLASNSTTSRITRAVKRGFDELVASKLADLPASRRELEEASDRLKPAPTVLLMGESATETAFKNQPLANFKVLHIQPTPSLSRDFRSGLPWFLASIRSLMKTVSCRHAK